MVCLSLSRKAVWTLPLRAVLSSTPWRVTVWGPNQPSSPAGRATVPARVTS